MLLFVLIGFFTIIWGFWAIKNSQKPLSIIGAFILPVALLATLVSIVLFFLPDFFKNSF